ncbi:unnamed protein product [Ixodes hexagonus]
MMRNEVVASSFGDHDTKASCRPSWLRRWSLIAAFLGCAVGRARCLDNGVALTPPMGWMSWERFRCNIDCDRDPNNCLSEKLFMEMADRLAEDGFRDAGYVYLIIDDCWAARERNAEGDLEPDFERFPRGIKFLSDYVHSKGLKFGMYTNYGHSTCMGFPGTEDKDLERDARRFASWGVDYLKVDGCHSSAALQRQGYPKFSRYLNQTGRPMVYSCSWPYYDLTLAKIEPSFGELRRHCNLWRNYHDIRDSWPFIEMIIKYFGDQQEVFADYAGPGHWNDPDMLMIGNVRLTPSQAEAHLCLWAILAGPLIMSNDLRSLSKEARRLLQDPEIIALDQDPLGIQGRRVYQEDNASVWVRPVSPSVDGQHSRAVAFLNHASTPARVSVVLSELGLNRTQGYRVRDLIAKRDLGLMFPHDWLNATVKATGAALFRASL